MIHSKNIIVTPHTRIKPLYKNKEPDKNQRDQFNFINKTFAKKNVLFLNEGRLCRKKMCICCSLKYSFYSNQNVKKGDTEIQRSAHMYIRSSHKTDQQ